MRKFYLPFLLLLLFILFIEKSVNNIYAQNSPSLQRVYFKIKTTSGISQIMPYIHHEFFDQTYSLNAPVEIIEKLKKNTNFEFKGYVSVWEVTQSPLEQINFEGLNTPNILKQNNTQSVCSPQTNIPWGVAKVKGGSGGNGITVAVLDTGIYTNHQDLKNNVVDCRDAQYASLRKSCNDRNGHGTHVAGTIAANGKILGVAPQAKIAAIQVCSSSGYCYSDDVARGIKYAADMGYKIINLSLGGSSISSVEKQAIDYAVSKGTIIIAAAGNSGTSIGSINYPAAYYKVVAVGSTKNDDKVTSFSSRGINPGSQVYVVEEKDIEFAAPGESIESTYKNGCYVVASGTSMAAPHVSGLFAKMWQTDADSTRTYLQNRAKLYDIDIQGDDPASGFGLPTAP